MGRWTFRITAILVLLVEGIVVQPVFGRIWRDRASTHQTQAILIERDGDFVVLEKDDGTRVRVRLVDLSDEDQTHVLGRIRYPNRSWSDPKRNSLANGSLAIATELLVRVDWQDAGRRRSQVISRKELSERDRAYLASEKWHRAARSTWGQLAAQTVTTSVGCEGTIPSGESASHVAPIVDGKPRRAHAEAIHAFAISPDHLHAASSGRDIKLWSVADQRLVATFANPFAAPATFLTFSPNGEFVAAAMGDQFRVWSIAGPRLIREGDARDLNSLVFSQDSRSLFAPRNGALEVLSGSALDQRTEHGLNLPFGRASYRAAVEIDEDLMAIGGPPVVLLSRSGKTPLREVDSRYDDLPERVGFVRSLVATPDKKHLLAIRDNAVELIVVETGESVRWIELQGQLLGVGADASFVYVSDVYQTEDGRWRCDVGVRSLADGSLLTSMPVRLAYDSRPIGVSPDGQVLYAGASFGMINLWCFRERRWIVWFEDVELRKEVKTEEYVYRYTEKTEEAGKEITRYKYIEYFQDLPPGALQITHVPKSQMASKAAASAGGSSQAGGSWTTTYSYTIFYSR